MREKACLLGCLILGLSGLAAGQAAKPSSSPLPDPETLMQKATANERKLAAEQERYECRVTDESAETDSKGRAKHTDVEVKEQFYVNGVEVDRTLSKNGKSLTGDAAQKEDARVMKKTVKYEDAATAKKEVDKQNEQVLNMMAAMVLANGRREVVDRRSVLFYDVVPNPKFHAKNLTQRFAQVMQGTMSIDEQTGEMIDLNIRSVQDLKIAGGLLVNLHKGFWLHVHDHAQPDGVWLTDLAEGTGDARAALFLHPYFRFREATGDCHLYTATAHQVGQAQVVR